jgi:cytoskeletal protein RodZ
MLPGFRFLFAAIVLSLSILVFGLGAAAFLRAAHEQFASLPSRRAPAEPVFTRQNDAPMPTLALLRFDPPAIEKTPDNVPAVAAPETVTPAAQAPDAAPVEPEKLAALPEEPTSTDATAAAPATETTAAVVVESPAPVVVQQEVKVAAIAEAPQPSTAAAPATDTLSPEANIAATRIATLGGPIVIIDADAKPDRSTIRKRAAQRARERRRIAARRARLAARQAALAAQQLQANPFGQTQTPVARVAH